MPIWWIAVWTLFAFQKGSDVNSEIESYKKLIKNQALHLSLLFQGTMDSGNRQNFIRNDDIFWTTMQSIPETLQTLRLAVMSIRALLLEYYYAEGHKGRDLVVLTDDGSLHDEILEALRPLMDDTTLIAPIKRKPSAETKTTITSKRTTYSQRTEDHAAKRTRYVLL